ncbi:DNA polymerase III subunit gamma and tau [Saccharopolyspora cebuensis]|uniref:DNA polymerase III subunit gamma/tau n=1 Tax=Saccharopolyspora cebuensis TaxID=418759 RepID=A0ABV4CPE7_9PSEU
MALALYRKYRPATFAEVAGQDHVTAPLRTALASGRINHAYLFSGPRGCGKTSSARILARSLNCAQGPTADPCGECDSCAALAPEGAGSVDVVELDAASHGGVDDTRELRDRAFFAPAQSRYRIFIIDEAHMVTTQGFNALLKIVEEPPEHLIFIFATTEPDKVLTTIRSRTHHYPFRLMPPGVMRELVDRICQDEGVRIEPAVHPLLIRAGGGSARDTLSVLDQLVAGAGEQGVTYDRAVALLGVTDVALIDDMVDALAAEDGAAVYGTVDRLVEAGHDPRRFASDLLDRLRDLVLLHTVPDAAERGLVDVSGEELTRMTSQAERLGAATLTRCAEIVHTGLTEMRGATAPRLLLELLCARMLLPAVSAADVAVLQRLERVENRMTIAPGAPAAEPGEPAPAGEQKPKRVFQRPHERAAQTAEPEAPAAEPPAPQQSAPQQPEQPQPAPQQPAAQQPERQPEQAEKAPEEAVQPEPRTPTPQAPAAARDGSAGNGQRPSSAPTPEPAASTAGADAAEVRRVWTEVLRAVAERNRPTQALLLNATVQDLQDTTLVLSMPTSGLVKQLAQQRRLEFVKAALASVLGEGDWEVHCVEAGAAPARPAPKQQAAQRREPPQRRSQNGQANGNANGNGQANGNGHSTNGQAKPNTGSPGAGQNGNGARATAGRATVPRPPEPDDIPPPPEPPDEEPPPDDIPPPPEPPAPVPEVPDEEEDAEAMLAGSSPVDGPVAPARDVEAEAVDLLSRELGARKVDD